MRRLVDVDHGVDDAFEKGPVVAHDHQTTPPPRKEVLETVEPVEVEIVRRLVEEEKIVERKQQGGQGRACPLPSRERRGRELEQAGREPEVVEHAR
jgi:hypothetical protein